MFYSFVLIIGVKLSNGDEQYRCFVQRLLEQLLFINYLLILVNLIEMIFGLSQCILQPYTSKIEISRVFMDDVFLCIINQNFDNSIILHEFLFSKIHKSFSYVSFIYFISLI